MSVMQCPHRAVLIVTRKVEGTTTNVARRRLELQCRLEPGHSGDHRDPVHDESWQDGGGTFTTVLRHDESD